MINSTLKMVRHRITETYQDRIEIMYGAEAQSRALEKNIEVLEQMFMGPASN